MPDAKPKVSTPALFLALLVSIGIAVAVPFLLRGYPTVTLVLVLAALTLTCVAIGGLIVRQPLGILITEHNTMSLSRFQAVLWTVLVLAVYMTIVLRRIAAGATDASDVTISNELLALMGISFTSIVGSSIATSVKTQKPATDDAKQTAAANADANVQVKPDGVIFGNAKPSDASFVDIFQGDELTDAHLVDLSKVQMFFFTIVAAILFLSQAFHQIGGALAKLPTVNDTLVGLMGISHAAYLANKTVTRTPAPQPGAQPQDTLVQGLVNDVNTVKTQISSGKWISNDAMVAYVKSQLPPK